jgi:hypothetical protein
LTIPNDKLYLGFGKNWGEVKMNNKIPLHLVIYTYGLVLFLIGLNAFEIFTSLKNKFFTRLIKSLLTVILIYSINAFLYKLIDNQVLNLYWYPRGNPATFYCFVTLIFTTVGICGLELINVILFKLITREQLRRFLPVWIIEKET